MSHLGRFDPFVAPAGNARYVRTAVVHWSSSLGTKRLPAMRGSGSRKIRLRTKDGRHGGGLNDWSSVCLDCMGVCSGSCRPHVANSKERGGIFVGKSGGPFPSGLLMTAKFSPPYFAFEGHQRDVCPLGPGQTVRGIGDGGGVPFPRDPAPPGMDARWAA